MQEDGKPQKVQVGAVSWEELKEIRSKTVYNMNLYVWIEGEVRAATLVKSLSSKRVHEWW